METKKEIKETATFLDGTTMNIVNKAIFNDETRQFTILESDNDTIYIYLESTYVNGTKSIQQMHLTKNTLAFLLLGIISIQDMFSIDLQKELEKIKLK